MHDIWSFYEELLFQKPTASTSSSAVYEDRRIPFEKLKMYKLQTTPFCRRDES